MTQLVSSQPNHKLKMQNTLATKLQMNANLRSVDSILGEYRANIITTDILLIK